MPVADVDVTENLCIFYCEAKWLLAPNVSPEHNIAARDRHSCNYIHHWVAHITHKKWRFTSSCPALHTEFTQNSGNAIWRLESWKISRQKSRMAWRNLTFAWWGLHVWLFGCVACRDILLLHVCLWAACVLGNLTDDYDVYTPTVRVRMHIYTFVLTVKILLRFLFVHSPETIWFCL